MVLYKEFRVGDLFTAHLASKHVIEDSGVIPVISGVTTSNGVIGYSNDKENKHKYEQEITVSNRGEYSGTAYYQKGNFILSNNVICLEAKFRKTDGVLLYMTSVINKLDYGGYSNYPTKAGILKDVIELPVRSTGDTEPDWGYMEDYIKQAELLHIDKLNREFKQKQELLKGIIGEDTEILNIFDVPTEKFKVGDLFEISRGLKTLKPQDRVKGYIPYINSSEENNGIADYIGNPTIVRTNAISIGLFGKAFYQEGDFTMANNTYSLENDNINKYTGLYICSALERVRIVHEFGYTNPITKKSLIPLEIELPINPELTDLVPDWETMEEYIKGIKHLYLHKEEDANRQKLELLFSITGWDEEDLVALDENRGGRTPTVPN